LAAARDLVASQSLAFVAIQFAERRSRGRNPGESAPAGNQSSQVAGTAAKPGIAIVSLMTAYRTREK
jgi:hypothetical protein